MNTFTIIGKAIPKGRPRVAMRGKFPHVYTPPTTKAWEDEVRTQLTAQVLEKGFKKIESGPIKVLVMFVFKKPSKADVDNLGKSILDAANGILYEDDSMINNLTLLKGQGNDVERVYIEISSS